MCSHAWVGACVSLCMSKLVRELVRELVDKRQCVQPVIRGCRKRQCVQSTWGSCIIPAHIKVKQWNASMQCVQPYVITMLVSHAHGWLLNCHHVWEVWPLLVACTVDGTVDGLHSLHSVASILYRANVYMYMLWYGICSCFISIALSSKMFCNPFADTMTSGI